MAFVVQPARVFPEKNLIKTSDIHAEMEVSAKNSPYLERVKAMDVGVESRYFVEPLEVVARPGRMEERNEWALRGMEALAEQASLKALDLAGLLPKDIHYIITSNSVSPRTPGADVTAVNQLVKLGMSPSIMRIPCTTLGCVGGAHALSLAAQWADANPGKNVLVLIPEPLSVVYQAERMDLNGLLWRLFFGDSAAACVVTSPSNPRDDRPPRGACMRIDDSWQYVAPNTMTTYRLDHRDNGLHFLSERGAERAVRKLKGPLTEWLPEGWRPETLIGHPGGPAVLRHMADMLGFPAEPDEPGNPLRVSWDRLRARGNLGGAAVLDVLAETATHALIPGSETLLLGIGPGITGAVTKGQMYDPNDTPAVA
ncbi:hypothetical protein [Streptomyces lydicus]|uniref:hypothetical protein n=1 Tax=Streptomyces lydicus TaxID=47763 RepID=UPI00101300F6|nr:hypothetical protein [Streptomyces lydicus]MCZ1012086.1 hypothetical protein [Streptomyces lydicus]